MGTREQVAWFRASLENKFEINTQSVGHGAVGIPGCRVTGSSTAPAPTSTNGEPLVEGAEGRVLNRVIRCTQKSWEVEPDQRHADLIIQELELDKANAVITPGEKGPNIKGGRE